MKNNVFSTWFRELCTLIFVQTFQAFLLAIIMSLIVSLFANDAVSVNGGIDAIGLVAIIALYSLSKIELLIKNIFGLTSGVADTSLARGQRGSLAGSMIAYHGLRRVFDNGGKIIGGAVGAVRGQFRVRQARNARNNAGIAQRVANGELPADEVTDTTTITSGNQPQRIPAGGSGGPGAISRLADNVAELNKTMAQANRATKKDSAKDNIKELDNALKQAEKERNNALKTMGSGITETMGALAGAPTGALVGLVTGGNIGKAAAIGAGVGDAIGEAASHIPSAVKEVKTGIQAEGEAIKNRKAYKKFEEELKRENKKDIQDLSDKIDMYMKAQKTNSRPANAKNSVDEIN